MILFLGDSFTWGQGLQIPYWIEQGKSIEEINKHLPPDVPAETYDYYSDLERKKLHYPNLVAKHFNKSYAVKFGNGGTNSDILFHLNNLRQMMDSRGIDFFVIQLTEVGRDLPELHDYKGDIPVDEYINSFIETQMKQISNVCSDKPWFVFSWRPEFDNILSTKYKDNFVKLEHNNKTYLNFQDLGNDNQDLYLGCKYDGIDDNHLTPEAHEIFAKSIIKKVENSHIY